MGRKCCAPGCRTGYSGALEQGVSLHSFPKEEELLQLWISAIPRDNYQPNFNSVICSLHFHPSELITESRDSNGSRRGRTHPMQRTYLSEGAIPSTFPNLPAYLLRKLKCKERSHVTQQDILQGNKERSKARAASFVASSPPRMTRTNVSPRKESTATIDPKEKLAEDIRRHLGIEINGSFHGDLTSGEKVEAGRRLKGLLGAVADGALVPLMHFTLDEEEVHKLASLKDSADSHLVTDHLSVDGGDEDFPIKMSDAEVEEDLDADPLGDLKPETEANVQSHKDGKRKKKKKKSTRKRGKYFECDSCDYKASISGNLRRHVRAVHEGIRNSKTQTINVS